MSCQILGEGGHGMDPRQSFPEKGHKRIFFSSLNQIVFSLTEAYSGRQIKSAGRGLWTEDAVYSVLLQSVLPRTTLRNSITGQEIGLAQVLPVSSSMKAFMTMVSGSAQKDSHQHIDDTRLEAAEY